VIVVADSSVLICLSAIGQLGIIHARFPEGAYVAPAVWREVVEQGRERPGGLEVAAAAWIATSEIKDHAFVQYLKMGLDDGEAESIGLARELKAGLILLDERDARDVAKGLGLKVLGTIGLREWQRVLKKDDFLMKFLGRLYLGGN